MAEKGARSRDRCQRRWCVEAEKRIRCELSQVVVGVSVSEDDGVSSCERVKRRGIEAKVEELCADVRAICGGEVSSGVLAWNKLMPGGLWRRRNGGAMDGICSQSGQIMSQCLQRASVKERQVFLRPRQLRP